MFSALPGALLAAFSFLTTWPVAKADEMQAQDYARALYYYPLVGLILGLLLYVLALLSGFLPLWTQALLLLLVYIASIGLLHFDGLADCADAWVGGHGDRDRSLKIMKDVHNGAAAQLVLAFLLLAYFIGLVQLLEQQQYFFLIVMPVLGRLAVPLLWLNFPYVSKQGIASAWEQALDRTRLLQISTAVCGAVLLLSLWMGLFWKIVVLAALLYLFARSWRQRIGGISGDVLGAAIVLTEAGFLLLGSI